jgi:hypothetical protein
VIKLLRRLFGTAKGGKISPTADRAVSIHELLELIKNRETRPAVLETLRKLDKEEPLKGEYRELLELLDAEEGMRMGLDALTSFALGKGALAESIISHLATEAPDFAGCNVNQEERMVLNLWGVALCVMRGLPKVSGEEKHAFLDQYHQFILSSPEDQDARSAWPVDSRRINALCQVRYPEYFNAFDEEMRRQEAAQRDPSLRFVPATLMRTITKNLFGLESDSLTLSLTVHSIVMNQLITFTKVFGTPEAWATIRNLAEGACRALSSSGWK